MLGVLGLLLIVLVLFSGNASAADSGPVHYIGDTELAASPLVTGSGTEGDPYVFADIEFECAGSAYGLWIQDTTSYVMIENCTYLNCTGTSGDVSGYALYLQNVSHAMVVGCSFLNVNNGIVLRYSDNCTLLGNDLDSVSTFGISIGQSYRILTGLNFNDDAGTAPVTGIDVTGSEYLTINDTTIVGGIYGIRLTENTARVMIDNTSLAHQSHGVSIDSSSEIDISNSRFSDFNDFGYGIYGQTSTYLNVRNCTFSNGGVYSTALELSNSEWTSVDDNRFNDTVNAVRILYGENTTITGNLFTNGSEYALIARIATGTVTNNTVDSSATGFSLQYCSDLVVSGNLMTLDQGVGLDLNDCQRILIEDNYIVFIADQFNKHIMISSTSDCVIRNNTALGYGNTAISAYSSNGLLIAGNYMENIGIASISLDLVGGAEVLNNIAGTALDYGLLISSSHDLRVSANVLENCIDTGISVTGSYDAVIESNDVDHGGSRGISISQCISTSNITLLNNSCQYCLTAIVVSQSGGVVVEGNDCSYASNGGIFFSSSLMSYAGNNTASFCGVGLTVDDSPGCIVNGGSFDDCNVGISIGNDGAYISNVSASNCVVVGIQVSNAPYTEIVASTFNWNPVGISIYLDSDSQNHQPIYVRYCRIENNTDDGLSAYGGFLSEIEGNHFANNVGYGVHLNEGCDNWYHFNNTFLENNYVWGINEYAYQAYDRGSFNQWSSFEGDRYYGNGWSHLPNVDIDEDGYVDSWVYIGGSWNYYNHQLPYGPLVEEPGAPTDLVATLTAPYVELSWNAPTQDGNATIIDYQILVGTSPGSLSIIANSYGELSYTITLGLTNGNTYYFAVQAVNYYYFTSEPSEIVEVAYFLYPDSNSERLVIHSNEEFATFDQMYGWAGDGSQASPYIIEALIFDGGSWENCVEIWDTDAYFEFRNCTFYYGMLGTSGRGVDLLNVFNGRFVNCTFTSEMQTGIWADYSQFSVEQCLFTGSLSSGLVLDHCNDVNVTGSLFTGARNGLNAYYVGGLVLSNNIFEGTDPCLYAYASTDLVLSGNTANGSRMFDIYDVERVVVDDNHGTNLTVFVHISGGTDVMLRNNTVTGLDTEDSALSVSGIVGLLVEGNDISDFYCAIVIQNADQVGLFNNTLYSNYFGAFVLGIISGAIEGNNVSNNRVGIQLASDISGLQVTRNVFLGNVEHAIYVDYMVYATIFLNLFEANNGNDGSYSTGTVQAYDKYLTCTWELDGLGNYWSEWTSPDDDNDGIVDDPYLMDGMEVLDYRPLAYPFGTPTGLQAMVGNSWANLSWNGLTYDFTGDVDGFVVYRSLDLLSFSSIGTTAGNWFNDTGLTKGVTYYYAVAAYRGSDIGPMGPWVSVTPCDPPSAPLNLVVARGVRSLTLSWEAPADDGGSLVTDYAIWRGASPSELAYLDLVKAEMLEYVDAGLADGVTYYYAIRAVNQAGTGSLSTVVGNATFDLPSVPTNVATQFGNGNITVLWSPPTDDGGTPITGYVIEVGHLGGAGYYYPGPDERSLLVTSLLNGEVYTIRVRSVNAVGHGEWSSPLDEVPATVPGSPIAITAAPGAGTVSLAWQPPFDDGGDAPVLYRIYRRDLATGWALIDSSPSLTFEDTTVVDGALYYYRVSAVNKAGEGAPSYQVSVVPGLPLAPTGLAAMNSAGKVLLNWTAPDVDGGSAIIDYKVYRDTGSGYEYIGRSGSSGLTYLDGTAAPGVEYRYRVSAVTAKGEGALSNPAVITLPLVSPEAPVIDSAVQDGDGVLVIWHVPVSSTTPDQFLVYRGATPDGLLLIAVVNGAADRYLDVGGTAGLYYALRSSNQYGVGNLSEVVQATLGIVLPPEAPLGLAATAGDSLVTLSWTASDGAVGYHVYRDNGSGYALLATTSETEYADGTVVNGASCSYRVTAFNDGGESGNSTTVLAIPGSVPGAVQNLALTEGEAIVTLTWDVPADDGGSAVLGYRVYRDLNGTVNLLAMVNAMTYTDHDVVSGLLHTYWIVALNAWGAGPVSAKVNVTPDEIVVAGLPAPSYLLATVGNGTVTLTWDPMTSFGVDGFRVFRSDGGNFTFLVAQSGSTYADSGLTNGVTYTYRVYCFIGTSDGENASVDATPGKAPEAPTLNGQVAVDRITLGWSVPENGGSAIIGYRLYRTPGTGTTILLASLSGTGYIDTSVLAGVNYTYMVTALNAFGEGSPSNTMVLRTSTQPSPSVDVPAEPYLSSATGGNTSISLLWNVPSDTGDGPITGYNVYRGTSALSAQLLVSVPAGTNTYVDGTAVYGTTYYYWVSALNQWGESELSRVLSASLIVLAVPGEVDVDVTEGQGRITLSWDVPDEGSSSVTEYRIYRRGETGDRQLIATVPAGTDTFVDGSVEAGAEYDYWVTAVNAAGEGPLADSPVSGVPLAIIAGEAEIGPLPMIALALGIVGLLVAIVAIVLVLRKK